MEHIVFRPTVTFIESTLYYHYIKISSVGTGGGCRLIIREKAMIPKIWPRIAKFVTVSIYENLTLYSSRSLYHTAVVL